MFLTPFIHYNCHDCSADVAVVDATLDDIDGDCSADVAADVAVVDATLDDIDGDCSADVAVADVNSGVVYVAYYSSRRPLLYTFTIKCTR